MAPEPSEIRYSSFALLTNRLLILPTPTAVSLSSYRALYASLHANPSFCEMAFSHHFRAVSWSDAETREVINTRDIERCWTQRGMGDFAVGLRPAAIEKDNGRALDGPNGDLQIFEGADYERLLANGDGILDTITWVGYAGVRDATTTSMPEQTAADPPLPPWLDMIEVRYGVAPGYWGKGIARAAAEAVMQWAVSERGVTRFIAETERGNARSGRVLEKMGFKLSGTDYWKEPSEVEWERVLK
ncbi:hypothetical protein GQ53DRAFT_744661 [Thozetella sp. PMI_491]|nr:hypothetical protein GQ53DRAFT_744661 [Thozetella sp. PMI_491]